MINYKQLYERVGSVIGWDFSKITKRTKVVGKKWDYIKVVKKYINKETILLDIGTGGGELLLKIAPFVKKACGIDHSRSMIKTARKNLAKSKIPNVEFKLADAKRIPFSKEYFNVVICRHSDFYPKEVFRVLKPNGIFITQQVGEKDKENIKKIFGRGQHFGKRVGTLMNKYLQELKKTGFKILKKNTYNALEYYANMEDLIFLLKNTPIIPDFNIKKDQKFLEEIERRYKTKKGIKTNSFRFLIICKKPAPQLSSPSARRVR
ncbi:methyltransferase domain-containing protein [bacterium]|nr:methyltransferase domain-containing protein [bacterium]